VGVKPIKGWQEKIINNVGELSPKMQFRTDLEVYKKALKTARNCFISVEGVISNAPQLEEISRIDLNIGIKNNFKLFEFIPISNGIAHDTVLLIFTEEKLSLLTYTVSTKTFSLEKTFDTLYGDDLVEYLSIVQLEDTILIVAENKKPSMIRITPIVANSVEVDFWENIVQPPVFKVSTKIVGTGADINDDFGEIYINDSTGVVTISNDDLGGTEFDIPWLEKIRDYGGIVNLLGGSYKIKSFSVATTNVTEILLQEVDPSEVILNIGKADLSQNEKKNILTYSDFVFFESLFGEDDLYPTVATKYQNRLVMGDFQNNRNAIAVSVSGNFLDFTPSLEADGGVTVYIPDERVDKITSLVSYNSLIAFTEGGVWSTAINSIFSPTNSQFYQQINIPPSDGQYTKLEGSLYYSGEFGNRVYTLDVVGDYATYSTKEVSIYSRHLFQDGIGEMGSYVHEGSKYLITDVVIDGIETKAICTINKEQQVKAWQRYEAPSTKKAFSLQNESFFVELDGEEMVIEKFSSTLFRDDMVIELLPPLGSEALKTDLPFAMKEYRIDKVYVAVIGEEFLYDLNGDLISAPFGHDANSIAYEKHDHSLADSENPIKIESVNEKKLTILSIYYQITSEYED